MRVQLHFVDPRNKKLDIIHHLKVFLTQKSPLSYRLLLFIWMPHGNFEEKELFKLHFLLLGHILYHDYVGNFRQAFLLTI